MNKINYTIAAYLLCNVVSIGQDKPDEKPLVDIFNIAKITTLVHDEDKNPIDDVDVHLRFLHLNGSYRDGSNDFYLATDANGKVTAESESTGAIFITASKAGYYTSELQHQPTDWSKKRENKSKLLPWNPAVPIILKKVGKGAPMYARGAPRPSIYFPSQDKVYGFDLVEDDWVHPHGKGKVSDLLMLAHMDMIDDENYDSEMTINFPNQGDGLIPLPELHGIESELKYPREAPTAGYRADPISLKYRRRNPHDDVLPEGGQPYGYILRLRTKMDTNGKVISAIYAKIINQHLNPPIDTRRLYNPINFGSYPVIMKDKGQVSVCFFTIYYYLNPKSNDRTLEFDQKNNLVPNPERAPGDYEP